MSKHEEHVLTPVELKDEELSQVAGGWGGGGYGGNYYSGYGSEVHYTHEVYYEKTTYSSYDYGYNGGHYGGGCGHCGGCGY